MFAYCGNNPIISADYSGNKFICVAITDGGGGRKIDPDPVEAEEPESPRNITNELNELMRMHCNELANVLFRHVYFESMDYSDAWLSTMRYFANKVKTGGEWDLKNGDYPSNSSFIFYNQVVSGADVGNIHYGYVGYSVFPELGALHFFAGLYQIYSNTHRPEWAFWYFDDPRDYDMIQWGIDLYQLDFEG